MKIIITLMMIVVLGVSTTSAQQTAASYLDERSKYTGTVDIYDADIDQVRNLKVMSVEGSAATAKDTQSGDTVVLAVNPDAKEITITSVTPYEDIVDVDREFTDEEILAKMKSYFEQRSKMTGKFMQYDEAAGKMLNLEFVELDPALRKFGKLAISTATFNDPDSGKTHKIDITVSKKDGKLFVKSTKIKK